MTTTNKLVDRIARVITTGDNPRDVFEALIDCYAFQMSLLTCPDCRKQAARALKQAIPQMLADANQVAAEYAAGSDGHECTRH
jgi:hypothetical protein